MHVNAGHTLAQWSEQVSSQPATLTQLCLCFIRTQSLMATSISYSLIPAFFHSQCITTASCLIYSNNKILKQSFFCSRTCKAFSILLYLMDQSEYVILQAETQQCCFLKGISTRAVIIMNM